MSKVIATGRNVTAVDAIIAKRLRARRQEMGLSQQGLSTLVGITFQQIQKYENAINRIAASRLFAISKALDTPMSYFFEPMPKAAKRPAPHLVVASRTRAARKATLRR
jgi:transcriptional regulator with XRE-family HTH domain